MVEDIAVDLFGEAMCKQLGSANWKERLEAVEEITKVLLELLPSQYGLFSNLQYLNSLVTVELVTVELIEVPCLSGCCSIWKFLTNARPFVYYCNHLYGW